MAEAFTHNYEGTPEAHAFGELIGGLLERRDEAFRKDQALQDVRTNNPSMVYVISSDSTPFVPSIHERICLVPTDEDFLNNGISSVKFYTPVEHWENETFAKGKEIYVSVRRKQEDGTAHTARYKLEPNGNVEEYMVDPSQHETIAISSAESEHLLQVLHEITGSYALANQRKRDT